MCERCGLASHRDFSRRQIMTGAGTLLAASALRVAPARAAEPPAADTPNAIAPSAALEQLMQGNARYVAGESICKDYSVGRDLRADAQFPIAAILSCADSRVAPELLFDQGPGDIFVV